MMMFMSLLGSIVTSTATITPANAYCYYCSTHHNMNAQVRSRRYSRVIGADLSPAMLGETARRFDAEKLQRPELIRCDVTRLPVSSSSVDGIHAGAALHCWSKLEQALQEVRVQQAQCCANSSFSTQGTALHACPDSACPHSVFDGTELHAHTDNSKQSRVYSSQYLIGHLTEPL
jgi:Methyltransferase domain